MKQRVRYIVFGENMMSGRQLSFQVEVGRSEDNFDRFDFFEVV